MNSACLNGFGDCSSLTDSRAFGSKHVEWYKKPESLLRSFLLISSFALFTFVIAPEAERSLPSSATRAYVAQSKKSSDQRRVEVASRVAPEQAAKAVLVLGLITGQTNN